MPKIINISRRAARKWEEYQDKYGFYSDNCAWISISEPDQEETIASNPILDKLPNLKIAFWDTTFESVLTDVKNGKEVKYFPPTYADAREIVNFILKNKGKDIISQCAAGYSRSTAVCQFCEDILGYEWIKGKESQYFGKAWSSPNIVLYRKMVDFYQNPVDTCIG